MSTKLVTSGPFKVLAFDCNEKDHKNQIESAKNVLDNTSITLKLVETKEPNIKEVKPLFTFSNVQYNKIGIIINDTLIMIYDRENIPIRSGKEADTKGNKFKRDLAFNVPEEVHLLFNMISEFIKSSVTKYLTSINIKTKCNRISTNTYSPSTENDEKKFILKGIVSRYSEFFCMCDGKIKPLSSKNDKVFTSLLKAKTEFSKNLFVFNSIVIYLAYNRITCVADLMSSIIKPYVKTYSKTSFMDTIEFTEEEKKNFNVDESIVNNLNSSPQESIVTEKTNTNDSELSTQDLLDALDENN
jgi:hypothetical protein